jgi:hypothetical protein
MAGQVIPGYALIRTMRPLLVSVIAAALALSACGSARTSSSDVSFTGAQKDVADVVTKLATAGRRGDAATICSKILAKQLLAELKTAGGNCETEMKNAIRDASDYDLQVRSVKIAGAGATAQVRQGKDGPVATFTFVKEGGGWRASALGGS